MNIIDGLVAGCNVIAAGAGVYSARYWVESARARVIPTNEADDSGWIPASVSGTDKDGTFDWFATLREQGRLNGKAAYGAAIAAAFMAGSTFLQILK
jgi:hypothetical protein